MKKIIILRLKAKKCRKEFKKDMGISVLAYKELIYELDDPKEFKSAKFGMELLRQQKIMMEEYVEVEIEEVPDK